MALAFFLFATKALAAALFFVAACASFAATAASCAFTALAALPGFSGLITDCGGLACVDPVTS
jgi:hypothetical protein